MLVATTGPMLTVDSLLKVKMQCPLWRLICSHFSDCMHSMLDVLSRLATVCGCGSCDRVLVGSDDGNKGVMKDVLTRLKPFLTRDKWKSHPAHKQSWVWCVRHVTHPHLSPHLDSLLPPTLLFLDDHEDYHKILGLTTATHIIKNVVGSTC